MIPWIQVYSNLIQHPKTTRLADELALTSKDVGPNIVAAGMLVSLWLWAAQNATNGDLSQCTDRAIAEAAGYKKKPSVFVAALTKARFLDADRKLHDWDEYATLLMDIEERQRQQTRERVQKHRANKKAKATAACNGDCNVTPSYISDGETPCNAPTVPNRTLPYQTLPNNSGGGSSIAGAEATDAELSSIGLRPGEYLFGVTKVLVSQIKALGSALFRTYAVPLACTPADCRNIFRYVVWDGKADSDAVGLLEYAFEAAHRAGKSGNWNYIEAVLARCSQQNIYTAQQARDADEERGCHE